LRFFNFFIETAGRAAWNSTTTGYVEVTTTASNWVKTDLDGSTNSYIGGLLIAPSSDQAQYSLYGGSTHKDFSGGQFTVRGESSVAMPDPNDSSATDLPTFEFLVIAEATSFSIPAVTGAV